MLLIVVARPNSRPSQLICAVGMNAGAGLVNSSNWMRRLAPAGAIVALSYVLAFAQRPGRVFLDTRIELTLDPVRFLHSVASLWSSTGDLGHFQGGQFVGYLVPMAPWYAFAHTIGLSTWVAERIWMGSLLAAAGLGVMVLLRQLARPRRLLDRPDGRRGPVHGQPIRRRRDRADLRVVADVRRSAVAAARDAPRDPQPASGGDGRRSSGCWCAWPTAAPTWR